MACDHRNATRAGRQYGSLSTMPFADWLGAGAVAAIVAEGAGAFVVLGSALGPDLPEGAAEDAGFAAGRSSPAGSAALATIATETVGVALRAGACSAEAVTSGTG